MQRQRYMIVEHSTEQQQAHSANPFNEIGNFQNVLSIHHLLYDYHWTQLDSTHVLVLGTYPLHNHSKLLDHIQISILPSVSSSKKLKHCVKKNEHWNALRDNLAVSDSSVMDDILDNLEALHGLLFGPLR